jgi:two-component system, cell cycle sensor histidine kinase and response regulator CckA
MKSEHNTQHRIAELEEKCERLEKALRQSEDRFSTIFNAASNPMTITTVKDGRMLDLNEACVALSGYKREELIGTLARERSIWSDPEQRKRLIQKLKETGRVHNLEATLQDKNGELHKVLFSADPANINNEPCLLGVLVDITAREREAEALRKSEEKYRMLVEHSLQGLAIIQGNKIKFCNGAYASMTGYSVEEVLSLPDTKIFIHPQDRELIMNRSRDRLMGKPVPSNYAHRIITKNGETRWLEINAALVEYEGESALQIACIDITERRQAEEALRESEKYLNQIINCIGDSIFVIDRQHKFILLNDASCDFVGKKRDELIGRPRLELPQPGKTKSLWEQEEMVFETGREIVTEDSLPDREGNLRTMMTKKSLLVDRRGNKHLVGVSRDITDYKRLQNQFLQAQKMEAIGVLAGGIAHDFNNLLNVINGYSEMMLEKLDPNSPLHGDMEQIKESGQRAASLTSQLLAFSRKQILQPKILDLNIVISQMISMLSRMIGEDIEIVTATQPGLGKVNADPVQIQQIIMNLAVNARDAMPRGGKLTIETANVDCDENYVQEHPVVKMGPYVMLAITDSGIGMDETTKAHLFEPFFTTKEKGKGTGLGLSTIYGIVKQSNGFIWVYSEPGKGTAFKIYFPRVEDEALIKPSGSKVQLKSRGFETVLVVEDEESVKTLACRILRGRGYTVLDAPNGKEALRIAANYAGEIHLVLTDVVMPGMSGKDLVSELQSIRPDIKALYVSGYADNAIVHHGRLDPGVAFLQKPFAVEGLARKVREVMDA